MYFQKHPNNIKSFEKKNTQDKFGKSNFGGGAERQNHVAFFFWGGG